jgi:hypothetical protein
LPPTETQDWVIVVNPSPVLASKETLDVMVALDIKKGHQVVPRLIWYVTDQGDKEIDYSRLEYVEALLSEQSDKLEILRTNIKKQFPSYTDPQIAEIVNVSEEYKAYKATERLIQTDPEIILLSALSHSGFIEAAKTTTQIMAYANKLKTNGYIDLSSDKKWEFWIVAYDASQSGQVTTQLASRWCVTMR